VTKGSERKVRQRALVIGGSVGGLFAAHLLRKASWDVAVFERAAGGLGDRGTGIGTRAELFAAMQRAGIAAEDTAGIDVSGRVGLGPDGRVIHERPLRAVTSAWSRIWRPAAAGDAGRALSWEQDAAPDRATCGRCQRNLRRWRAR